MVRPLARQKGHVRFTPESGHVRCTRRCPLCANSGQGSAKRVAPPTSAGRRKDHEKGTAPALTEGEHDACGSAHVLATDRKRRSTGSDCTSHDCRRSRSADILRLSDTRSSTAYHRRPSQSPRTMEPRSSLLPQAVGQRLEKQERQPRKPCGSSSTPWSVLVITPNNRSALPDGSFVSPSLLWVKSGHVQRTSRCPLCQ